MRVLRPGTVVEANGYRGTVTNDYGTRVAFRRPDGVIEIADKRDVRVVDASVGPTRRGARHDPDDLFGGWL
jgi:hypothetical protein